MDDDGRWHVAAGSQEPPAGSCSERLEQVDHREPAKSVGCAELVVAMGAHVHRRPLNAAAHIAT